MKIAITGASGFLGRYLVDHLIRAGHELFLFTRSLNRIHTDTCSNQKVTWLETDYSQKSLDILFSPFDAMVHLASKRYLPGQKAFSDYQINIDISKNVFKACEVTKTKNVIFSSSRSIYSTQNKPPFSENDAVSPENPYSLSKLKIEEISKNYDITCKSLRISQLIGWGEREGFMFNTFLSRALEKKPLTVFGKGSGRRDYLYVKDAAGAIEQALLHPHAKGVFNVGSGQSTSHLEFAVLISEVFSENESPVIVDRGKEEDPDHYLLDIHKFKTHFNWVPRYHLKEAFEDMKKDDRTRYGIPE